MAKDFEFYITKLAWDDAEFAKMLEDNPVKALESKGIKVSKDIKLNIVLQKKNTIYFSIPPAKKTDESPKESSPEIMDVWSSGNFFIWFAPVALKFCLFQLRHSVPEMED